MSRRILYPYWMSTPIKECGSCAQCCETNAGNVAASGPERETILDYCLEKGIRWNPLGETACGFLSEEKRCRIYAVRPSICRTYGAAAETPCDLLPDTLNLVPYSKEQRAKDGFAGEVAPLFTLAEVLNGNAETAEVREVSSATS